MALETTVDGAAFLLGRVLFGGLLAFMGLNHFLQREELTGYAAAKGLPAPGASVLGSGAILILGGLGVVVGAYPAVAAAGLAVFLLSSAVTVHDFWAVDDPEARQQEMTQFLKNAALAGGALTLVAVGGSDWPLSLGLGLA